MRFAADRLGVTFWNGEDIFLGIATAYFNVLQQKAKDQQWTKIVPCRYEKIIKLKEPESTPMSTSKAEHQGVSNWPNHREFRSFLVYLWINWYGMKGLISDCIRYTVHCPEAGMVRSSTR